MSSIAVVDRASNRNDHIVNVAEAIGRSKIRRQVFEVVYNGKKKIKTLAEIRDKTGLSEKQILDAGKNLIDKEVLKKSKKGRMAYEKDSFIHRYKNQILACVDNPKKRDSIPTKVNPGATKSAGKSFNLSLKVSSRKIKAHQITIDDVASFSAVRKISKGLPAVKISESAFKNGIAGVLRQRGNFKDWGGENRDLSTTQLVISQSKRVAAAFAFKGPGKSGKLTPGKMGKNGDQIQRLVLRCPAQVFFVQYWGEEVDDSVYELLETLAQFKSFSLEKTIWYGVIDGSDSARLIAAYPKHFKGASVRA